MNRIIAIATFILGLYPMLGFAQSESKRFTTLVLSDAFHSEGAAVADLNGDGHADVVSGCYWYPGPKFERRWAYAPIKSYAIKGYSDHFFSFARDFNQDGHTDILSIPIPGGPAVWYENPGPGKSERPWTAHPVLSDVSNESPTLADIDGDGRDELICIHAGRYGYGEPSEREPHAPWKFVPISDRSGYGRFTHGLGVGDVNGDGRLDLLEKDGWWEQLDSPTAPFEFHAVQFAESGGSQMFAYDLDGDGDNDVISSQNAHAHGLCWFEQRGGDQGEPLFVKHTIMGATAEANPYGLAISQLHAVALADIDGDGVRDIVTGKRFWAHGGRDPGAAELPVLYWFRTKRSRLGVEFVPMLIDARVGVGTQLTMADLNDDARIDIVVGNKLGTFVMLNHDMDEAEPAPSALARHRIGTDEFKTGVRNTEPLSPNEELATFVLPVGFRAELVAAEPDIAKPMNLAFDHRGRLWVSSSEEYPYPAPQDRQGRDTIKVLEDTDDDGTYDKITTFADNLNIPIGLYPYGQGVICFSIPNILYLRDSDGDGKADQRDVLYGPFDTTRDTHGMCNAFTRGYDGWLYACHGFNNQSAVSGRDGNVVTMHSGNTFRMRLDGSRLEHFTHGQVNPFGMALDPSGDLLTADCHTKPVTLLLRGGYYPSFGKPHDGLGFVPDVMEHLHGSTAIGGLALYHDQAFPAEYHGSAFGGNVMTSRINRNSLIREGASVRAQEEADFLISGDPWFRPVDLQLGPDGALYVADFYNRIIGHYEVPLDHPGRDRHRGRIWRIVYEPTERRPAAAVARQSPRTGGPTADPLTNWLEQLKSTNLTARMLASDAIVDQVGAAATDILRRRLRECDDLHQRIHLLWILKRLDVLPVAEIEQAVQHDEALVRNHAMQLIAATDSDPESTETPVRSWLIQGLQDSDHHVRRSAALATSVHRSEAMIAPLFAALSASRGDAHLKHAIRMALRDHLRDPAWFASATANLNSETKRDVLALCLAIKSEAAGEYVAEHLDLLSDAAAPTLSQYLTFASRYASEARLASFIEMVQQKFSHDRGFQTQLLESMRDGLLQRGKAVSPVVVNWASSLARSYLGMGDDDSRLTTIQTPIGWTYVALPAARRQPNPWMVSTKRSSADGQQSSVLFSSFPKGETQIGIYRSDAFALPSQFSFYFAGHDGYPDKPIQNKNGVRARDAKSHAILKSWKAPRNDTAQPMLWSSGEHAGKQVYLELIDRDKATAYAWIAVGRFSVPGLNPSGLLENRRKAAQLIKLFRLRELASPMQQLMAHVDTSPSDAAEFAAAFISDRQSALRSATAEALAVQAVDGELREKLIQSLSSDQTLATSLAGAMKVATAVEQARIAAQLASDRVGLETLLQLIEQGHASPRLLLDPSLLGKAASLATSDQKQRAQKLVADLPDENQTALALIEQRKRSYLQQSGDASAGHEVFKVQCGICHKVAGVGAEVGPNLDGIGNRGLDRLLEDVMLPNRNVDAAFRASVILTSEGQVISGLVKRIEGAQLIVVDNKGKELAIPRSSIEEQKQMGTSPMPTNVHENLSERQMNDLLAYLLSLTI